MSKPLLLDLFCGAGGCAKGYMDAGFYVIGVDIQAQPRYIGDEFYQEDALAVLDLLLTGGCWHGYYLHDFAVIHASPPCQEYSRTRHLRRATAPHIASKAMLIEPVRERLERIKLPWIIENVEDAPLPDALELCGSMFGLPIRRHRWFSSSHYLYAPRPCRHTESCINVVGGKVRGYGALASTTTYLDAKGCTRKRESYFRASVGYQAMDINWMTLAELSEAIPPAYTRWIGLQLMDIVLAQEEIS